MEEEYLLECIRWL